MYENEMNLQSAAANIGYEYASRGFCGSSVKPEPETFDEAVVQLLQEKEKEVNTPKENQDHVTADTKVIAIAHTLDSNCNLVHIRSTFTVILYAYARR